MMFTSVLLYTVLYCSVQSAVADLCQTGWVPFGDSCYMFSNANATWGDALGICNVLGSYLVEIETSEENHFLKDQAALAHGHNFWTGGNDIEQEAVWRWITSKDQVTFTDWSIGQPSNLRHRQDCLVIHHSQHNRWHDFDCRSENFFICEKKMTIPETTQEMTTTQRMTSEAITLTNVGVTIASGNIVQDTQETESNKEVLIG